MQCLPADVFQELQQQGKEEDGRESQGAGGKASRGGTMGSHPPSQASETSFSFTFTDGSATTQPSKTPPLSCESPRVPRGKVIQVSNGRCSRSKTEGPEPTPPTALERQGYRPAASTPPSRASASKTLSPQLLGGRAGSDAGLLTASADAAVNRYKSSQKASTTAALKSLISSNTAAATAALSPGRTSPPGTTMSRAPVLEKSPCRRSTKSSSSLSLNPSTNSSCAYELCRQQRPDMRLIKTRSRLQRRIISRKSFVKGTKDLKKPSLYYGPKFVEDTIVVAPTTTGVTPSLVHELPFVLTLPRVPGPEASIQSLREVRTLTTAAATDWFANKNQQDGSECCDLPKPTRSLSVPLDPNLKPESSSALANVQQVQQLTYWSRSKRSTSSGKAQGRSSLHIPKKLLLRSSIARRSQPSPRISHQICLSTQSKNRHGHSQLVNTPYFASSCSEPTHIQEIASTPSTLPTNRCDNVDDPFSMLNLNLCSTQQSQPLPSPSTSACPRKESISDRRRSIFSLFRRTVFNDKVFERPLRDLASSRPTSPVTPTMLGTPDITVTRHEDGYGERGLHSSSLSELRTSPSILRHRERVNIKNDQLSPFGRASQMATIEDEDTPRRPPSPKRHHNRSSSEQLSPKATPRARPRLKRHRHKLGSLHATTGSGRLSDFDEESYFLQTSVAEPHREHPNSDVVNAGFESVGFTSPRSSEEAPAAQEMRRPKEKCSPDSSRNSLQLAGVKSSLDLSLAKAEGLRDKRQEFRCRSSWKVCLHSFRNRESKAPESMFTSGQAPPLRQPLLLDKPLPPLPTREMLKQDSPIVTVHEGTSPSTRLTDADLEIENFQQTPFIQRYHDSKRTLQQQIRALIDECMDDDDEGNQVVLGFEHNVPDHFPNSPLCPLHPKHKSGGKAICPLHGRFKRANANAILRIGPARSRRALTVSSLKSLSEDVELSSPTRRNVEEILTSKETENAKGRTKDHGSDGLHIELSPRASAKEMDGACITPRTGSDSEFRGRQRTRAEYGSWRHSRRHRVHRR